MKFWFCETCGKRLTDQDLEAGAARNKKLNGVFCEKCADGVMTMEMMPVNEAQAMRILGKSTPNANAQEATHATSRPLRHSSGTKIPVAHSVTKPLPEKSKGLRTKAIILGVGGGLLAAIVLIFALRPDPSPRTEIQRKSSEQAKPTETSASELPSAVKSAEASKYVPPDKSEPKDSKRPVDSANVTQPETEAPRNTQPQTVVNNPTPEVKSKENEAGPSSPKNEPAVSPSASTDPRAAGMTKSLVQKAFKGEVLRADEDLYVELRYDFVKNPQGVSDFTDKNLQTNAAGLALPGVTGQVFAAANARLDALFQPKSLYAEVLLINKKGGCIMSRIGNLFFKVRRAGPGQLDVVYEEKYTGSWGRGMPWNYPPDLAAEYRYVFERTPEHALFKIDETEHAKVKTAPLIQAARKDLQSESIWYLGFAAFSDSSIREMVVKGYLDRDWLIKRAADK